MRVHEALYICFVALCGIQPSDAFLTPSHSIIYRNSRIRSLSIPSSLQVHVASNETEALLSPPPDRVSLAGSAAAAKAKQAIYDELDFERVKDPRFLQRNKKWIVLIDDEEAIRLSVGDYLYDQGYQVTACADADAFLDVCRQRQNSVGASPQATSTPIKNIPDAIVSDIRMPGGKDGLELLGLIRSDERLSRVPVILLTAKGMTTDRIAGYKAGANGYLPKPFAPEELLSMLDNCIQRRQQMTKQNTGSLIDLKQEMADIKEIMKRNGEKVVQKTNVYLTLVEREVLELLCKGYTNKEIADTRGVNVVGVNRMIQKLYKITETETRTELVRWAMKTGYVPKR